MKFAVICDLWRQKSRLKRTSRFKFAVLKNTQGSCYEDRGWPTLLTWKGNFAEWFSLLLELMWRGDLVTFIAILASELLPHTCFGTPKTRGYFLLWVLEGNCTHVCSTILEKWVIITTLSDSIHENACKSWLTGNEREISSILWSIENDVWNNSTFEKLTISRIRGSSSKMIFGLWYIFSCHCSVKQCASGIKTCCEKHQFWEAQQMPL